MKRYFLILCTALFIVACSSSNSPQPEPPKPVTPEITTDKNELNFTATAQTLEVTLNSNVDWQILGAPDWVTLSATKGTAGTATVKIVVAENTQYSTRNSSLTIMGQTKASSQVIVIRQAEPGALILSSRDTTIVRHSSQLDVKLLTNIDYTFTEDADWIEIIEKTKALRPETVRFKIHENHNIVSRTATITLAGAGLTDKIKVTQEPNGTVVLESPRNWDGVKRADMLYEIFVRSFADSNGDGIGDLKGITDKLDYIESLGVTGIWLTPINPSPSYHGYDVENYTAVNPQFGPLADFDELVAKAKAKGIKVVLDFVINHSSKTHPWFTKALADPQSKERGYYTFAKRATLKTDCESGKYPMVDDNKYVANWWHYADAEYSYYGMFSDWMPDFDYGRVPNLNPVYNEILDAAEFWMKRGIAGLRLDAVKHIYQDERGQENIKLLRRFYEDLNAKYPNIYMIGEVLSGTDDSKQFLQAIPSVFHFDSWWKLDDALGKSMGRYYAKDMAEALVKFGGDARRVGTKLSNHDEDRAMSKLGMSVEKAKVAFAAIMSTPGQPYIYYGEELGMSGMKEGGDENVREPLIWGDSYTATWRNGRKVASVVEQSADKESLLSFYRDLTRLRNTYPALASGSMSFADPNQTANELMVLTRSDGGERVMVVANFSNKELEYKMTEKLGKLIKAHNGAQVLSFENGDYVAVMKPYSVVIAELK